MSDQFDDAGLVARHGWAALLKTLTAKGVLTHEEAQAVIMQAHRGAEEAKRAPRARSGSVIGEVG